MWKEVLSDIKKKLAKEDNSHDEKNSINRGKLEVDSKPYGLKVDKKKAKVPVEYKKRRSSAQEELNDDYKKDKTKKKKKRPKTIRSRPKKRRQSEYIDPPIKLLGGQFNTTSKPVKTEGKYKFDISLDSFEKPNRDYCDSILAANDSYKPEFKKHEADCKRENILKELVIGLDFGTAFTKVVIGETTYAHAIDFDGYGFLLPSKLNVDSNGRCSIDKDEASYAFKDLKLPLLLDNARISDHVVVVAFFARVFYHCRKWVDSSIYSEFTIDWLINVGLPTESYHDVRLRANYEAILHAAWILSYSDEITLQGAKVVIEDLESKNSSNYKKYALDEEYLHLFPEFAAQIVGYVQSPSRREHSHLLVDVGAGTLDVAMFVVSNDKGNWLFKTAAKDINTLGGDVLAKHRMGCLADIFEFSSFRKFPTNREFAKLVGIDATELNEIDKPFRKLVNRSIHKVISEVAGGHKFSAEITTFICGGGSNIALYKDEIGIVTERYPLNILPLPAPERLRADSLKVSDYHRLSVAYGLSFDPYNIGEVIKVQTSKKAKQKFELKQSDYLLYPK